MAIIINHDAYPNSQWLSLLMIMTIVPIIIDSIIIDSIIIESIIMMVIIPIIIQTVMINYPIIIHNYGCPIIPIIMIIPTMIIIININIP